MGYIAEGLVECVSTVRTVEFNETDSTRADCDNNGLQLGCRHWEFGDGKNGHGGGDGDRRKCRAAGPAIGSTKIKCYLRMWIREISGD